MKKNRLLSQPFSLLLCLLLMLSALSIPATASSPVSIATDEEWDVLKIVNQERIKAGKQSLSMLSTMQTATDIRATELLIVLSHTRPNGDSWFTLLDDNSITYSSAGENIAAGQQSADAVMDAWMNSPGHKGNILSESYDYEHIGVGHYYSSSTDYGNYWVQLFIGNTNNSFSNLELYGGKSPSITLSAGQTLSDLNLALQCTSSVYGTCYLPLIDEMCIGYHSVSTGTQAVTVNYQGLSLTLQVSTSDHNFNDVSINSWYYDSVMYVFDNNIFKGTSDTTFSPDDTMTRAMMVQVLYNLEGVSGTASAGFTDIKSTDWFADAVNWAATNKIVAGVGNNLFSPSTPVTREEMAVILSNYCEYKDITLSPTRAYDTFKDQQEISSWAQEAVRTMYSAAVLSGMDDGTFSPKGNATRAHVAAMFKSFMEVIGN